MDDDGYDDRAVGGGYEDAGRAKVSRCQHCYQGETDPYFASSRRYKDYRCDVCGWRPASRKQLFYSVTRRQSWLCFKCGGGLRNHDTREWIGGAPSVINFWVPDNFLADGERGSDVSNVLLMHKGTCGGIEPDDIAAAFQKKIFPRFSVLYGLGANGGLESRWPQPKDGIEVGPDAKAYLTEAGSPYPSPGCYAVYSIIWQNAVVLMKRPDGAMVAVEFLGKKKAPRRFDFRPIPNPNKELYGLDSGFPTFRQRESYIGQVAAWRLFERWKEHREVSSNPGVRSRMEMTAKVHYPPRPSPPFFSVVGYFPTEGHAKRFEALAIKGKADSSREAVRNRLNIQERHRDEK